MKRIIYLIFILFSVVFHAAAQKLTAEGPAYASVGSNFRIEFSVNEQRMENFHLGSYPEDAIVLVFGPAVSSGSYYSNYNGKSSQTFTTTYTYTFVAKKAGTFTMKGATATVNGKQVKSNDVKIQVTESDRQAQQAAAAGETFMHVSVSKRAVYEQEPIVLTYKLYTSISLASLSGELPELTDFMANRLGDPNQQVSIMRETYNGRPYTTLVWREYLLFPQKTGTLKIPAVPFEITSIQRKQYVDPFEEFMNGGSGEVYNKSTIKSSAVDIHVEPLPEQPAHFSGGVGHFTISSSIDNTSLKANDVLTLKVTIRGQGNLNLVRQPEIAFPADFDTYDPQVTDNTTMTSRGVEGSIEYEYTAVPRNQGEYDIPPIAFAYFDPDAKAYKTLYTEGYHLKVAKGKGGQTAAISFENSESATDIRPIKKGATTLLKDEQPFFGSQSYLIVLVVLLLVFISLFVIFRQRAIDNADIVKSRGKRANKVAAKRLKTAARLMKDHQQGPFYDETLRALWGYVGDKLNMPVEELSRENITDRLLSQNVTEETTRQFVEAIDECEFERYAPGDPQGNMNKVYEKAMTAIEHIEDNMKHKRRKVSARVTLFLCLLTMSVSGTAATKQEADAAYLNGAYQKAIQLYEAVLASGVSAEVYYNLGNAYYRTEQLTLAILNYERALQLSPGDADIRHNLQVAQSKTVDKITPESEMFFITWYHALVNVLTANQWAYLAIISLALAIILALIYLFAGKILLRKCGFFGGAAMVILFLLANVFAWQQQRTQIHRDSAVVMSPQAPVKNTPASNGKDIFVLHEGTTVTVTDTTMTDWKEVHLSDGRKGWMKTADIEMI